MPVTTAGSAVSSGTHPQDPEAPELQAGKGTACGEAVPECSMWKKQVLKLYLSLTVRNEGITFLFWDKEVAEANASPKRARRKGRAEL